MTTTKPDVDLAGIRQIVEAPFDHEQYVNLWLVEQVPALLDLVDAQRAEIERLTKNYEAQLTISRQQAASLTASASTGRNAGEVARGIIPDGSEYINLSRSFLQSAITAALEARDRAHAGREERMRKALEEINSWRNDTLGNRPHEDPADNTPANEAFDRGCAMAFYRCVERARAALADQPASKENDNG